MESQNELVGQDNSNTCLVCLSAQGGVHFQIVSCRACSGFFKRSINLDKKYRCRRGTYDCSGYPELCRKCKYCRFKRCQQLGMSIKEKPFGRKNDDGEERISTSISSATSSNSPTISIPENSSLSTPEMLDRDLFTIDEVLNIFRRNEKISQGMPLNNILNSTVAALKHYIGLRFKDVNKNMEIDAPFDFVELKTFHQDSFIYNAQLLMNFDAFIELGFDDKVFVYRTYWPLFSVFGDFLVADRVFGKQHIYFMCGNRVALNAEKETVSRFESAKGLSTETLGMISKALQFRIEFIMKPLRELNLNMYEVAYLTIQIIFAKRNMDGLSMEIQKAFRNILIESSTNLYNYYSHQKIDNFAYRISEITKLLSSAFHHSAKCKEIVTVAKLFGFFDSLYNDEKIGSLL